MSGTLKTVAELEAAGLVAAGDVAALEAVAARYAIGVTPTMADLIDRGDPDDPIALQFVPDVFSRFKMGDEQVNVLIDLNRAVGRFF